MVKVTTSSLNIWLTARDAEEKRTQTGTGTRYADCGLQQEESMQTAGLQQEGCTIFFKFRNYNFWQTPASVVWLPALSGQGYDSIYNASINNYYVYCFWTWNSKARIRWQEHSCMFAMNKTVWRTFANFRNYIINYIIMIRGEDAWDGDVTRDVLHGCASKTTKTWQYVWWKQAWEWRWLSYFVKVSVFTVE